MDKYYTTERNVQMIISLLKAHNIKKVIASPGTTNITFVGSIQNDPYFEIYSSVDERSAAYMACGLAAESKEPVVLSCTGATASRNYIPGMTEAFYRKLPIIALTASQNMSRIGQNVAQLVDRRSEMNDTVKYVAQVPIPHTCEDEEGTAIEINKAILACTHNGGGPVLINYATDYADEFSVKTLPPVHVIKRICYNDPLPISNANKVGILVGSHLQWDDKLVNAVEEFCEKYNGVVICDQTSNYKGKYGINAALISGYDEKCKNVDLLIDIGEISGGYLSVKSKEIWRVSPDGEIKQRGRKISYVFEMNEIDFFNEYNKKKNEKVDTSFYNEWVTADNRLRSKIPELPFSNIWMAFQMYNKIPKGSIIHLGILNTLRSWNYVPLLKDNIVYSNVGGFGIDGNVSSTIGSLLASPDVLHFGFVGDLAFFYDMNSIGNRYVNNNLRLMVINNGRGTEFRLYTHRAQRTFGDDADKYIAAAGHYGNMSKDLIKHYATDLGFEYISADNKEDFLKNLDKFVNPQEYSKPILFEVFTDHAAESTALKMVKTVEKSVKTNFRKKVGRIIRGRTVKAIIGASGIEALRKKFKK